MSLGTIQEAEEHLICLMRYFNSKSLRKYYKKVRFIQVSYGSSNVMQFLSHFCVSFKCYPFFVHQIHFLFHCYLEPNVLMLMIVCYCSPLAASTCACGFPHTDGMWKPASAWGGIFTKSLSIVQPFLTTTRKILERENTFDGWSILS